ncbi:MAG TPA: PIG-L family deacetylase [bacterium]|nr:PIG-L family deacetylase [bacterium]
MNILVIAAHPDDEILGCGGTLALHCINGDDTRVLILSDVCTSREENEALAFEKRNAMNTQIESATEIIGIKKIYRENLIDNRFDKLELLDIVKSIEKYKNEFMPDIIYTHFSDDLNIDHRMTFEAVLTAYRAEPGKSSPDIYSFFIPSSTEWGNGRQQQIFNPNYFVDISKVIDNKIEAMKCYKSELKPYPHTRSLEAVKIWANIWGISVGVEYAEPFVLIRKVVKKVC